VRDIEQSPLADKNMQRVTAVKVPNPAFMRGIQCISTCLGCLVISPSVLLSCGHTFCETCVVDITEERHNIHHISTIKCPFCANDETFSPRLLPPRAGYRILSLDGGGVRGIALIHLLAAIEKQCFGIPIFYLFDFIVGTSIGG